MSPRQEINSNLYYSISSLSSLRSKLYRLLGRIYDENSTPSLTVEEVEDWLKDLELAEKEIQKIIESSYKREDLG